MNMLQPTITNIVIVGRGGQGALTMMEMLALAAEQAEIDVRVLSRVSLARLGGAGICHVRLGPASSPAIPAGEADVLVSLEMSEVLRILPLARAGAQALISTYKRLPIAAGVAGLAYPTQNQIIAALDQSEVSSLFIPEQLSDEYYPDQEAQQAGRINMNMLGALSNYLDFLPRTCLEQAIVQRLPQFADQSLQAFDAGWQFARKSSTGA